jgi:hypothetical protein
VVGRFAQNREMPVYEGMDELSQDFARALFSAFPNWEPLAKSVKDGKTGASCLEVDVEQERTNRVLHLSTADDEITIGFEQWHTHVGRFLGIDTTGSVAMAMTIIENFVAERTVVKLSYRDGVWLRSSLENLAAPSEPEPHSTTEVLSWGGTYDETIQTP